MPGFRFGRPGRDMRRYRLSGGWDRLLHDSSATSYEGTGTDARSPGELRALIYRSQRSRHFELTTLAALISHLSQEPWPSSILSTTIPGRRRRGARHEIDTERHRGDADEICKSNLLADEEPAEQHAERRHNEVIRAGRGGSEVVK